MGLSATGSCMLLAVEQPHHPEHRQRPIPVGGAARDLSDYVHPVVRPSALVSPLTFPRGEAILPPRGPARLVARSGTAAPPFLIGMFVVLACCATASWLSPQAGTRTPHTLLPDDGGGRRARGAAGRDRRAELAARLLQAVITLIVAGASLRVAHARSAVVSELGGRRMRYDGTAFAVQNVREYRHDARVMVRNFYGVVRTRGRFHGPGAVQGDVSRRHQSRRAASRQGIPALAPEHLLQPHQRLWPRLREPGKIPPDSRARSA